MPKYREIFPVPVGEKVGCRKELYNAYKALYGAPHSYKNPGGFATVVASGNAPRVEGEEALENLFSLVTFQEDAVRRYETHGLACIHLDCAGAGGLHSADYLIDVDPLRAVKMPMHAWIRKFTPSGLYVMVSSGKQHPDHTAVEFDQTRTLEGLFVRFNGKVSPNQQIPYDAQLEPLYGK